LNIDHHVTRDKSLIRPSVNGYVLINGSVLFFILNKIGKIEGYSVAPNSYACSFSSSLKFLQKYLGSSMFANRWTPFIA